MELDLCQPFHITVEAHTSQRRRPARHLSWVFRSSHAARPGTSEMLMRLATHLRGVVCGTTDDPPGLHSFFDSHNVQCPCMRLKDTPGIVLVTMRVTQPHIFTVNGKNHHLEALHPTITVLDLEELQTIRCDLCHGSVNSVMYASRCGHHFHVGCISRWGSQHPVCPACGDILHFST